MLFASVGEKADAHRERFAVVGESTAHLSSTNDDLSELRSPEQIRKFIQRSLADEMKVSPDALPPAESLIHSGVDSMAAVALCSQLEERLSVKLSMAEVLSGKSINELTERVISRLATAGS